MEQPAVVAANLGQRFSFHFLSIFVHISGTIRPITLIWASMERSSSPAEVEHRLCQFWSKVMTSEVEERPRLVTAGYGRHGSQWVNNIVTDIVRRSWILISLIKGLSKWLNCGFISGELNNNEVTK